MRIGGIQENLPLWPKLTVEVVLEGAPVRALLNTGSPVSIISIAFLLQALGKQIKWGQTPAEWKEVKAKLRQPTLILQNYSGDELDVM